MRAIIICALVTVYALHTSGLKLHLVGGGIASLSAAVFSIQNGSVPGSNVHIYDEHVQGWMGGALDAHGDADNGFYMRGGRMFELDAYRSLFELLKSIPCTKRACGQEGITLYDDLLLFYAENPTLALTRLMDHGRRIDTDKMNFNMADRLAMTVLLGTPEVLLNKKKIQDVLPAHFFTTNFWYMWATMLAFQPWHSAIEFRRYALRFIQDFPRVANMSMIHRQRRVNHQGMVEPIVEWLSAKGVNFHRHTRVVDIDFDITPHNFLCFWCADQSRMSALHLLDTVSGAKSEVKVAPEDRVIVTIGSIVASSTWGTHHKGAAMDISEGNFGASFTLWQKMNNKVGNLGNPSVFISNTTHSRWPSYTCTFHDVNAFDSLFGSFGFEPLLTFTTSPWLMTVAPKGVGQFYELAASKTRVMWGYGLNVDATGEFAKRPLASASGRDYLLETLGQMNRMDLLSRLENTTKCIPAMMPYVTSQFEPRSVGDRPPVVPDGALNWALIGQFAEVAKDVVFTVEYSVHGAMIAVKSLISESLRIPDMYNGILDLGVVARAIATMNT